MDGWVGEAVVSQDSIVNSPSGPLLACLVPCSNNKRDHSPFWCLVPVFEQSKSSLITVIIF